MSAAQHLQQQQQQQNVLQILQSARSGMQPVLAQAGGMLNMGRQSGRPSSEHTVTVLGEAHGLTWNGTPEDPGLKILSNIKV